MAARNQPAIWFRCPTANRQEFGRQSMGMPEIHARAFEARHSQYLLIKAPPASGRVAGADVPGAGQALQPGTEEGHCRRAGTVDRRFVRQHGSHRSRLLRRLGFHDRNNLCTPGGESSKVEAVKRFLAGPTAIMVCTHATLRFAFDAIEVEHIQRALLAIDEFHHVSADQDNRLGEVVRSVMANTTAHVVAMTGSYFRGDAVPVLTRGRGEVHQGHVQLLRAAERLHTSQVARNRLPLLPGGN